VPYLSSSAGCFGARDGCATVSRLLDGDPAGTAAHMSSWLLIEQPGPWAADALEDALEGIIDTDRLAALRNAGLRPLLIRRPGRHPRAKHARRTVFVASGRPGNHWLERLDLTDRSELAALDLEAVAAGRGGHGRRVKDPMLLVCTHGSKDVCCAVLGRPLVAGLARDYPGRVWEVSHVGGDRWAGNLLVVPAGYLHGQLEPAKAGLIAKAAMSGEVHPDYLRGRTSAVTSWEQAAEITVRRHTGLAEVDDVLAVSVRPDDRPDTHVVLVAARDHRYEVAVRRRVTSMPATSRCADRLTLTTFPVVGVRRIDE
jgi:hypothetical protein